VTFAMCAKERQVAAQIFGPGGLAEITNFP
jgi:hypothetical protein